MKCKFSKVQYGSSDDFKLEGLVFELALAARVETSQTEESLYRLLFGSSIFYCRCWGSFEHSAF
jgi:hypothetical protein